MFPQQCFLVCPGLNDDGGDDDATMVMGDTNNDGGDDDGVGDDAYP